MPRPTGTTSPRPVDQWRRLADGDDRAGASAQRLAQLAEVTALEAAAENHDEPPIDALDRPRRRPMLVAFESFTKRTPSIDDQLHRVLEAGEALDGTPSPCPGRPASCDRRRGSDVG